MFNFSNIFIVSEFYLEADIYYSIWLQEVHEPSNRLPLVRAVPRSSLISVASIQEDRRRRFRFCLADQGSDPGETSVTFPGFRVRWRTCCR